MKFNYSQIKGILFDKEWTSPIWMKNDKGLVLAFAQIFAIKRRGKLYCILRPLANIEGLDGRAALVFFVNEKGVFFAVKDKEIANSIFAEYYKSLEGLNT